MGVPASGDVVPAEDVSAMGDAVQTGGVPAAGDVVQECRLFWRRVTNSTVEFSGSRLRNSATHPDRFG